MDKEFSFWKYLKMDCDGCTYSDYIKIHWIVHFYIVNCMLFELYLNKTVLKNFKK